MENLRLIERTLYPPIVEYLNSIGCEAIGEAKAGKGASDIVFDISNSRFVVETKIGNQSAVLSSQALAQAFRYANKLGTSDIIVLIYSEELKQKPIPDNKWLTHIAINQKVKALIFTEYWEDEVFDTPQNIFTELKKRILHKKRKINLEIIVKQIETIVDDLSRINSYVKKDGMIKEVTQKLDLFTSIGDIKNEDVAKTQVTYLASYLLFNQILFFQLPSPKA